MVWIKIAISSGKEITLDMSEFHKVKNDKIQFVKVHYDAQELRKEFDLN
jgi:hypothetical protein